MPSSASSSSLASSFLFSFVSVTSFKFSFNVLESLFDLSPIKSIISVILIVSLSNKDFAILAFINDINMLISLIC